MSGPARLCFGCLVLIAGLVACATCADAQRYSFKHYTQQSGLTNLSVTAINQDQSGYLWVATQNGLFRYDGRHFERFGRDEGLRRADITTLAVAADGTVWAGDPSGVAYFSGNRFHPVEFAPGIEVVAPGSLAPGPDGAIYAGGTRGLTKISRGERGVTVRQYWTSATFGVAVDQRGTVWFGCGTDLCELRGETVAVAGVRLGLPRDRWDSIVSDPRGAVWVRSTRHLYKLGAGSQVFEEQDKGLPTAPTPAGEMRADAVYGITVPTDEGLAVPDGKGWRIIGQRNGLADEAIAATFRDREGSLWLGLGGSGVDRWVGESEWENWTKAEGLATDMLWGIDRDLKGRLWAGTNRGVSMIDPRTGHVRSWSRRDGITGDQVRTVAADPKGEFGSEQRREDSRCSIRRVPRFADSTRKTEFRLTAFTAC